MKKKANIGPFDKADGKIITIKEDSIKRMNATKKEIELRFDPNINKLNTMYRQKIDDLREIDRYLSDLVSKKKRLKTKHKKINIQLLNLIKKKKVSINMKLDDLNSQEDFRIKKIEEEINYLERRLRILDAKKFANKWRRWATFRKESKDPKLLG